MVFYQLFMAIADSRFTIAGSRSLYPTFAGMFFLDLLQKLQEWDRALFNLINNGLDNPLFDAVMPFLRIAYVWAPFYLFIIVFVCLNYKGKGVWWVIFFLLVVACADMVGTNIFKYNVHRIRPCNVPELFPHLR